MKKEFGRLRLVGWVGLGLCLGLGPAAAKPRHKATAPKNTAPKKSGAAAGWQQVTIAAYRGIRFADNKVVDSDDKTADVAFPLHPTSLGLPGTYSSATPFVYLDAPKAKGFDAAPDVAKITAAEVETWEDQALGVAPGRYFVIRTAKGQYALIRVVSFTDKTKDYHFWKLTLAWKIITLKT